MSQIFNRVYRLLRSYSADSPLHDSRYGREDSDFKEAWEELDDFLSNRSRENTGRKNLPPEALREDYKTIGVEFGAPFSIVRERYIFLVKELHPDLYMKEDADLKSRREERMKKINMSFQKIKTWETSRPKS